jgi:hypothetical protein
MNLTALWCFMLNACEPIHIFSAGGNKTATTMMTTLDASLQNLFTCVIRPLGSVHLS